MTIIPASRLTDDDLRLLGNNLTGASHDTEHSDDDRLAAERSLASLGEDVDWLDSRNMGEPPTSDEPDYPVRFVRGGSAA